MKSSYLVSLGMSAAMAMAVGACADEAAAPAMPEGEITARLTVTVSREAAQDPSSRLTHSENAAGLKAEWEQGDHLLFCYDTNDAGAVASTLTLESIDASDASVATFTGDVTIPASALAGGNTTLTRAAIAYLGKTAANAHRAIATSTTIDISTQDGRFDAMAWNDVMALRGLAVSVTPKGNNQYAATVADGSIIPLGQTENRKLAFAHFTTNLAGGSTVTITGNTYNAITLNISGSDTRTEGSITVTTWGRNAVRQPILASRITVPDGPGDHTGDAGTGGDDDDDDFVSGSGSASVTVRPVTHMFVALIPTDDAQPINFEAVEPDGTRLTYTLDARELTAGHFYRPDWDNAETEDNNFKKGIYLKFEELKDTPQPTPDPNADLVGPTFTLSNGMKIRFTRANLQFNTKTREFSIPEYQTDYVYAAGLKVLKSPNTYKTAEVIGLFRWGATDSDDDVYQAQPADFLSNYVTADASSISSILPSSAITSYTLLTTTDNYIDYGKAWGTPFDWGFVYSNQLGQNLEPKTLAVNEYVTIPGEEFKKILEGHLNPLGQVTAPDGNVVNGMFIFESNSVDEVKAAIEKVGGKVNTLNDIPYNNSQNNKGNFDYNRIKVTYDQLQELNAVFFPAAGSQYPGNGTRHYGDNTQGYYWWGTITGNYNSNYLEFDGQVKSTSTRKFLYSAMHRSYACSVRLAKIIEMK